jgi:hypothetical protein
MALRPGTTFAASTKRIWQPLGSNWGIGGGYNARLLIGKVITTTQHYLAIKLLYYRRMNKVVRQTAVYKNRTQREDTDERLHEILTLLNDPIPVM